MWKNAVNSTVSALNSLQNAIKKRYKYPLMTLFFDVDQFCILYITLIINTII